jgi:hypothetical protein
MRNPFKLINLATWKKILLRSFMLSTCVATFAYYSAMRNAPVEEHTYEKLPEVTGIYRIEGKGRYIYEQIDGNSINCGHFSYFGVSRSSCFYRALDGKVIFIIQARVPTLFGVELIVINLKSAETTYYYINDFTLRKLWLSKTKGDVAVIWLMTLIILFMGQLTFYKNND